MADCVAENYLQCVEDGCGSVNLPPELLQDVIHLVHHLLADSPSGLDGLEALQKFKSSISTAQFSARQQGRAMRSRAPSFLGHVLAQQHTQSNLMPVMTKITGFRKLLLTHEGDP